MTQRRILFDLGTVIRASGHNDGITRTTRAFARFAATHRPDVIFTIYDTRADAFYSIRPDRVGAILEGAKVDTSHMPDLHSTKRRLRDRLPPPLRGISLFIRHPRRRTILMLERMRLKAKGPTPLLDRLQERAMNAKFRAELMNERGGRRTLFSFEMVTERRLETSHADIVLLTGSDWPVSHRIATRAGEPKSPRIAALCYDLIPLLLPHFFLAVDARMFKTCFDKLLPAAELMFFTAQCVEQDAQRYCNDNQLALHKTAVVPLGTDLTAFTFDPSVVLPEKLMRGQYALFVSTIEPRKNHVLLFNVWKRLIASGIPQVRGFKLVFLGRVGWLMKDRLAEMMRDPVYGDSLIVISGADDDTLHQLYFNAAFCLYPSMYEGFGLPVIEGFRHGKAVIASTGGALPETVQNFSPCLDPNDEEAWFALMKDWIEHPEAAKPYEDAIRTRFRLRDWESAGRDFFNALDRAMPAAGS